MVLPLLQPATFYRRDFPSLCGLSSDSSSFALTENAVVIKYLHLEEQSSIFILDGSNTPNQEERVYSQKICHDIKATWYAL